MTRSSSIPTTTFIPPYPLSASPEEYLQWFRALSGFLGGIQGVKNLNGLDTLRIGPLVYIQGEFSTDGSPEGNFLPIAPRSNGFLTAMASDGQLYGLKLMAGDFTVYPTGFPTGSYFVQGAYIAQNSQEN